MELKTACEKLTAAGAKRALLLNVGGAFHSPLMEPARMKLAAAIDATNFNNPVCPVFQNVNAMPSSDPNIIRKNLVDQLTAPVRWTQTIQNMIEQGAKTFVEVGPGKVLQGLVKKINSEAEIAALLNRIYSLNYRYGTCSKLHCIHIRTNSINELFDLLRIPSVSADSKYKEDVQKAADFIRENLIASRC
jgi:malonyl CoA-acyl carrier protein transacylase